MAVFLSVIGRQMYTLLRNLLVPDKPHDQSLSKILETLRKHYEPIKVVIAEQFTFHRCNQGAEESVAEYVAELRKLTLNFHTATLKITWKKPKENVSYVVCTVRPLRSSL